MKAKNKKKEAKAEKPKFNGTMEMLSKGAITIAQNNYSKNRYLPVAEAVKRFGFKLEGEDLKTYVKAYGLEVIRLKKDKQANKTVGKETERQKGIRLTKEANKAEREQKAADKEAEKKSKKDLKAEKSYVIGKTKARDREIKRRQKEQERLELGKITVRGEGTIASFHLTDDVIYLPKEANGDKNHPSCEQGVVEDIDTSSGYVMVNYGIKAVKTNPAYLIHKVEQIAPLEEVETI